MAAMMMTMTIKMLPIFVAPTATMATIVMMMTVMKMMMMTMMTWCCQHLWLQQRPLQNSRKPICPPTPRARSRQKDPALWHACLLFQSLSRSQLDWVEFDLVGLVFIGYDLVWLDLIEFDLILSDLTRLCLIRFDLDWIEVWASIPTWTCLSISQVFSISTWTCLRRGGATLRSSPHMCVLSYTIKMMTMMLVVVHYLLLMMMVMMMTMMKHLDSPVGRRMEAMVVSRTEIDHCLN